MTDKLLRAYGEIDDRFIEECLAETDSCIDGVLERDCGKIVRVNTGRKTKPAAWHRVAAAVILVALALSTAYQVNAQFRQWVISIVRLNGREEIREQHMPAASGTTNSSEAVINVSPVKKIDDILEVQYVTAKKPVEPYEDIYVSTDGGRRHIFPFRIMHVCRSGISVPLRERFAGRDKRASQMPTLFLIRGNSM